MSDEEIEIIRSEDEFQRQNKLIRSLQTENTRLYQVEKQLQKEIQQLHLKLKNLEIDRATSCYENKNWKSELESNLKKSETQNIQYELLLKKINKTQEKDKADIQNLKQQLLESQNTIEKDNQIKNLQMEILHLNDKINELNQDHKMNIELYDKKFEATKVQLQQEQEKSSSWYDKFKSLQDEFTKLKDIYQTLNQDKMKLINQNDEMQFKLNQALIENQNLQNQFGFSQSQYQETQNHLNKILADSQQQQEEKRQAFQRQYEQLQQQYQEKCIQLEEIKQERVQLLKGVNELESLNISLAQKEIQIKDLSDQLLKSETDRSRLEKELYDTIHQNSLNSKKDNEIIRLKTKINEFDKKYEKYQKEKQQSLETIQNLDFELDQSQIKIKNLNNQVIRLSDELSQYQIDKESLIKQIEDLQQQYVSIQQLNNYLIEQECREDKKQNQDFKLKKQPEQLLNQLQEQQQLLDQIQKQNLPGTLGFIIQLIETKIEELQKQDIDNQDLGNNQYFIKEHICDFFIRMEQVLGKVKIKLTHTVQ